MTALPTWADTPKGRALIARIIANPPGSRIQTSDWGSRTVYRSWQQPDVAALKRLYSEWWRANFESAAALPEQPDELIGRVLAEAAEQIVEVEHLGPGRIAA